MVARARSHAPDDGREWMGWEAQKLINVCVCCLFGWRTIACTYSISRLESAGTKENKQQQGGHLEFDVFLCLTRSDPLVRVRITAPKSFGDFFRFWLLFLPDQHTPNTTTHQKKKVN
jgi:hypothetical protein